MLLGQRFDIIVNMRNKTQQSFNNILDTFGGTDGGGSFVLTKSFIEDFDKRAENGDKDAEEIIKIVHRFSNLINFANKK